MATSLSVDKSQNDVRDEIAELEARLAEAKQRLAATASSPSPSSSSKIIISSSSSSSASTARNGASSSTTTSALPSPSPRPPPPGPLSPSALHYLLLLSDSALPLGSFAFSSGLESYLAHQHQHQHRHQRHRGTDKRGSGPSATSGSAASFATFLPLALSSQAGATLPFVRAAYRAPQTLADVDDALDASVVCAVGRRASVAQGRALLGLWQRSFAPAVAVAGVGAADDHDPLAALSALLRDNAATTMTTTRTTTTTAEPPLVSAHLAPLLGAIGRVLGLELQQVAYVFMLNHVKALVSAAVRAGLFGPFQAQRIQASVEVQQLIGTLIERERDTAVEEAGQTVPVMDLWVGRHEVLYSKIFNS